ncbi:MAG: hypothetical protein M0R17_05185 [Candidatus Omnitrophica bacterium]|nr:hypothetical protein [Candidatus Omnitrophota bacterium]
MYLDLNRTLTENDKIIIDEHISIIINELLSETKKLDPKEIEYNRINKENILKLFSCPIFVEEIPNEYCSSYCCKHKPWFLVTTNKGIIKIGWRKRVINIDWTGSTIKETAHTLFPNEDVTRGEYFIHAWSLEKAKEYIDKLLA